MAQPHSNRARAIALTGGLAMLAAFLGLAAGAVARFVMDMPFTPSWSNAALVIGAGVFASTASGLFFAAGAVSARPARVLRAQE